MNIALLEDMVSGIIADVEREVLITGMSPYTG
jgi:hypothetical protein